MTEREEEDKQRAARPRLRTLLCERTGRRVDLAEHARCPYCFGGLADIQRGDHRAFCDYRKSVDPIHFGFHADSARHRSG